MVTRGRIFDHTVVYALLMMTHGCNGATSVLLLRMYAGGSHVCDSWNEADGKCCMENAG